MEQERVVKQRVITLFSYLCIILLTILTHSSNLTKPIIDNHSWHQSERISIAQEISANRAGFFTPQTLVSNQYNNKSRLFMTNPPFYEYFLALIIKLTGQAIISGRVFSIILSCIVAACTAYIGNALFGRTVGFLSGLLINTSPLFIFWGQSISPEMFATAFMMIATARILFFKRITIDSLIFLIISTSTKPYFVLVLIPLGLYLKKTTNFPTVKWLAYIFLTLAPYCFWVIRVKLLPADPVFPGGFSFYVAPSGLSTYLQITQWADIFIRERLFSYITTPLGGILLMFSIPILFLTYGAKEIFSLTWLGISFFEIITIAWANHAHNYNQLFIIPLITILISLSLVWLSRRLFAAQRFSILFALFGFLVIAYYLWYLPSGLTVAQLQLPSVRYEDYKIELEKVRLLVPFGSFLLVFNGNRTADPTIFHQIYKYGWVTPSCTNDAASEVEHYARLGAKYVLFFTQADYSYVEDCESRRNALVQLKSKFSLLYQGENIAIFSL